MDSFDKWFAKQGPSELEPPELPEGVFGEDGDYFAYCCVCNKKYDLFHDPIKEGFDQDMSYCGGSQWCCP